MTEDRFNELFELVTGMLAPSDRKEVAALLRIGRVKASVLQRELDERRERSERAQQVIRDLQQSLDDLRLSTKYLVFDLEATRRERDDLDGWIRRNAA